MVELDELSPISLLFPPPMVDAELPGPTRLAVPPPITPLPPRTFIHPPAMTPSEQELLTELSKPPPITAWCEFARILLLLPPAITALRVRTLETPPVPSKLSTKAFLVSFADFPTVPYNDAFIDEMIYSGSMSVNEYFEEVSYGWTELTGSVGGWYTLPHPGSNYCSTLSSQGLWLGCGTSAIIQDFTNSVPKFVQTQIGNAGIVLLLINGYGTIGLSAGKFTFFSATHIDPSQIIHEIGHSIPGVHTDHAAGLRVCSTYAMPPELLDLTSEGCFLERYGDGYDAMGAGNSHHFSTQIKSQLGMLESQQILTATSDRSYSIDQLELPSTGIKMLKIPLSYEMFYFLEYRIPVGFDGADTPSPAPVLPDGVLIRLRVSCNPGTDASTVRPHIVLNPGTPFLDPFRGIRVEVTSKDALQAMVEISGLNNPLRIVDINRDQEQSETRVSFHCVDGAFYDLEGSSMMGVWQTLTETFQTDSNFFTLHHTNAPTVPHFFYRMKVSQ